MKKCIWLMVLLASCIEPYTPSEIRSTNSILVIDGHIDHSRKSVIKLNQSQNLLDTGAPIPVTQAIIELENTDGIIYPLNEENNGQYILEPQVLAPLKHRLTVRTKEGKSYVSAWVDIMNSPPIDSVTWKINSDLGVDVAVSTQDSQSKLGYYRWSYEETWLYTSAFFSEFIYNDDTHDADYRTEDIYHCYQTIPSSNLLVTSSLRLRENIISKFHITTINQRDVRLRYMYSILVRQHKISEEGYGYYNELKKTTEDLGTIFSPMPSQVTGNFSCLSNPDEKVLGYFSIGTAQEKRIFIRAQELPPPTSYDMSYDCVTNEILLHNLSNFNSSAYLLTTSIPSMGTAILGYNYTTIQCADCRKAGGSNKKPDFWP